MSDFNLIVAHSRLPNSCIFLLNDYGNECMSNRYDEFFNAVSFETLRFNDIDY